LHFDDLLLELHSFHCFGERFSASGRLHHPFFDHPRPLDPLHIGTHHGLLLVDDLALVLGLLDHLLLLLLDHPRALLLVILIRRHSLVDWARLLYLHLLGAVLVLIMHVAVLVLVILISQHGSLGRLLAAATKLDGAAASTHNGRCSGRCRPVPGAAAASASVPLTRAPARLWPCLILVSQNSYLCRAFLQV